MDPLAAERLGDPPGQLGQPPGRAAHRGRLAEQVDQQLVVDVGPPGQPVDAHLGGHQGASGLGGHQEPEPRRVRDGVDAGLLVGVHPGQRLERIEPGGGRRREVEQFALPVARWDRRPGWRVRRDRRPGQPGPAGGQRPRLPPPPLRAQQQRLGQLQVVAALDADARAQQVRVDLGGRRPQPADRPRRPGGRGEVRELLHRAQRLPAVPDPLPARTLG